jgi:hypothetical protein
MASSPRPNPPAANSQATSEGDHAPLMGWARGTQALAAIWDQRFADAVRHAENGLLYVSAGVGAARIHAIHARALAACGDAAAARAAMTTAEKARADADTGLDELHDRVGGEFAFDAAKLRYYQALALLDSGDLAGAGQARSRFSPGGNGRFAGRRRAVRA